MEERLKTLVVNADDFGLSEGVNKGIRQSFERGIVRSASIVANGQAFDDAIRIANELPELGIGVHLTLVGEAPLSSAFRRLPASYPRFLLQRLFGRMPSLKIKAEIEAQVQRVLEAGIHPSHLDSHQHVHAWPAVARLVWRCARKYQIRVVRAPVVEELAERSPKNLRDAQLAVLSGMSRNLRVRLGERKIKSSDHFWGGVHAGQLDQRRVETTLMSLKPGVNELMCHPGLSDDTLRARYHWGYNWDAETAALTSMDTLEIVEREGIRLASFEEAWEVEELD